MTDLDRLLELCLDWHSDKTEIDSLKKQIQEAIEKAEKWDKLPNVYGHNIEDLIHEYGVLKLGYKSLQEEIARLKEKFVERNYAWEKSEKEKNNMIKNYNDNCKEIQNLKSQLEKSKELVDYNADNFGKAMQQVIQLQQQLEQKDKILDDEITYLGFVYGLIPIESQGHIAKRINLLKEILQKGEKK